jgi:prepilin-type N-terminal cleavage/methylation domain-containing protein
MTKWPSQPTAHDRGFTLVEVLCALSVLAIAVTGVFRLGVVGASTLADARRDSLSTSAAAQKMDELLALAWSDAVTDLATDLAHDPPTGGGPGLGPSPSGALDDDTGGWVDYLDGQGTVVADGARAVLVRRWSVTPASFDPSRALVLRVFVTSARVPRATSQAGRARTSGDVLLTTVRVRKAL